MCASHSSVIVMHNGTEHFLSLNQCVCLIRLAIPAPLVKERRWGGAKEEVGISALVVRMIWMNWPSSQALCVRRLAKKGRPFTSVDPGSNPTSDQSLVCGFGFKCPYLIAWAFILLLA